MESPSVDKMFRCGHLRYGVKILLAWGDGKDEKAGVGSLTPALDSFYLLPREGVW